MCHAPPCVCVCVCSSVCGHAEATDNASVNFVKYKGDYFVSTETNYMRRVDPDSLETKEKVPPYDWSQATGGECSGGRAGSTCNRKVAGLIPCSS